MKWSEQGRRAALIEVVAARRLGPLPRKDSEKTMLDKHVSLPWHKSSLSAMEKWMPLLPWENAAAYAEGVRRLRPTPYVVKFSDISRLYGQGYGAVRRGEKSAVQMIAELKPEIETLLRG